MDREDEPESMTVQLLREIRSEMGAMNRGLQGATHRIEETNQRLDQTNQRLDQTNQRLGLLSDGQIRLATEVAGLRGDVVELRGEVVRQGQRFDHFLHTEGNVVRDLRSRVDRLEVHTGLRLSSIEPDEQEP